MWETCGWVLRFHVKRQAPEGISGKRFHVKPAIPLAIPARIRAEKEGGPIPPSRIPKTQHSVLLTPPRGRVPSLALEEQHPSVSGQPPTAPTEELLGLRDGLSADPIERLPVESARVSRPHLDLA